MANRRSTDTAAAAACARGGAFAPTHRCSQRGEVPWRPLLVAALIASVLLGLRWWLAPGYLVVDSQMRLYPGVAGPAEATPPLAAAVLPLERDPCRGTPATRPALLLTDTASAWLGLVHGLRAVGLPLCITRDWREALEHKVVIVYPVLSGRALGSEGLRAVARHPQGGGTLIAFHVIGGELFDVFGFGGTGEVLQGDELLLDDASPLTARRRNAACAFGSTRSTQRGRACSATKRRAKRCCALPMAAAR